MVVVEVDRNGYEMGRRDGYKGGDRSWLWRGRKVVVEGDIDGCDAVSRSGCG